MRQSFAAALVLAGFVMPGPRSAHHPAPPRSVTVPFTLDHARLVVTVQVGLADGSRREARAWVDTGNPELWIAAPLARDLGLDFTGPERSGALGLAPVRPASPPRAVTLGGRPVALSDASEALVIDAPTIAPGLDAELNLPSTVLRAHQLLVDFPARRLTLADPGARALRGARVPARVHRGNGLVHLPATIGGRRGELGLDLGASFSFVAEGLLDSAAAAPPRGSRLTGAAGGANLWGFPDEPDWKLARVARVEVGVLALEDVGAIALPPDFLDGISARAGAPLLGLLGSPALHHLRVGIDYASSQVAFERVGTAAATDMDLVGLTLRPEPDGRYRVIGVPRDANGPVTPGVEAGDELADVDGVPVRGSSMGEVWALLRGHPGETRSLGLVRAGRRVPVRATVRRLLGGITGARNRSAGTP